MHLYRFLVASIATILVISGLSASVSAANQQLFDYNLTNEIEFRVYGRDFLTQSWPFYGLLESATVSIYEPEKNFSIEEYKFNIDTLVSNTAVENGIASIAHLPTGTYVARIGNRSNGIEEILINIKDTKEKQVFEVHVDDNPENGHLFITLVDDQQCPSESNCSNLEEIIIHSAQIAIFDINDRNFERLRDYVPFTEYKTAFRALPSGDYKIEIIAPGYQEHNQKIIIPTNQESLELFIPLKTRDSRNKKTTPKIHFGFDDITTTTNYSSKSEEIFTLTCNTIDCPKNGQSIQDTITGSHFNGLESQLFSDAPLSMSDKSWSIATWAQNIQKEKNKDIFDNDTKEIISAHNNLWEPEIIISHGTNDSEGLRMGFVATQGDFADQRDGTKKDIELFFCRAGIKMSAVYFSKDDTTLHHWICTFDSRGDIRIYKNGVAQKTIITDFFDDSDTIVYNYGDQEPFILNTKTLPFELNGLHFSRFLKNEIDYDSSGLLYVGSNSTSPFNYFSGTLESFMIFDQALTDVQIETLLETESQRVGIEIPKIKRKIAIDTLEDNNKSSSSENQNENNLFIKEDIETNEITEDEIADDVIAESFPDIDISELKGKAAVDLKKRKIINGYPDGEFKGDRPVNRAEAAKFLIETRFGKDLADIQTSQFSDVTAGEWFVKYVMKAFELNIINGYQDGSFGPADGVTTAQFTKMIVRTFELETNIEYDYTDVNEADWYNEFAGTAQKYNLFPDREDELLPNKKLTRYEVATAIYQVLTHIEN